PQSRSSPAITPPPPRRGARSSAHAVASLSPIPAFPDAPPPSPRRQCSPPSRGLCFYLFSTTYDLLNDEFKFLPPFPIHFGTLRGRACFSISTRRKQAMRRRRSSNNRH